MQEFLNVPSEWIYHWESLAIACAVDIVLNGETQQTHLVVFSDNTNSVNSFHSLRGPPYNNRLLRHSADLLITQDHQLQVIYIPGDLNVIADALSRHEFSKARNLSPGIFINENFSIPTSILSQSKDHLLNVTPATHVGAAQK